MKKKKIFLQQITTLTCPSCKHSLFEEKIDGKYTKHFCRNCSFVISLNTRGRYTNNAMFEFIKEKLEILKRENEALSNIKTFELTSLSGLYALINNLSPNNFRFSNYNMSGFRICPICDAVMKRIIDEKITYNDLWKCPSCGEFNIRGTACTGCKYVKKTYVYRRDCCPICKLEISSYNKKNNGERVIEKHEVLDYVLRLMRKISTDLRIDIDKKAETINMYTKVIGTIGSNKLN